MRGFVGLLVSILIILGQGWTQILNSRDSLKRSTDSAASEALSSKERSSISLQLGKDIRRIKSFDKRKDVNWFETNEILSRKEKLPSYIYHLKNIRRIKALTTHESEGERILPTKDNSHNIKKIRKKRSAHDTKKLRKRKSIEDKSRNAKGPPGHNRFKSTEIDPTHSNSPESNSTVTHHAKSTTENEKDPPTKTSSNGESHDNTPSKHSSKTKRSTETQEHTIKFGSKEINMRSTPSPPITTKGEALSRFIKTVSFLKVSDTQTSNRSSDHDDKSPVTEFETIRNRDSADAYVTIVPGTPEELTTTINNTTEISFRNSEDSSRPNSSNTTSSTNATSSSNLTNSSKNVSKVSDVEVTTKRLEGMTPHPDPVIEKQKDRKVTSDLEDRKDAEPVPPIGVVPSAPGPEGNIPGAEGHVVDSEGSAQESDVPESTSTFLPIPEIDMPSTSSSTTKVNPTTTKSSSSPVYKFTSSVRSLKPDEISSTVVTTLATSKTTKVIFHTDLTVTQLKTTSEIPTTTTTTFSNHPKTSDDKFSTMKSVPVNPATEYRTTVQSPVPHIKENSPKVPIFPTSPATENPFTVPSFISHPERAKERSPAIVFHPERENSHPVRSYQQYERAEENSSAVSVHHDNLHKARANETANVVTKLTTSAPFRIGENVPNDAPWYSTAKLDITTVYEVEYTTPVEETDIPSTLLPYTETVTMLPKTNKTSAHPAHKYHRGVRVFPARHKHRTGLRTTREPYRRWRQEDQMERTTYREPEYFTRMEEHDIPRTIIPKGYDIKRSSYRKNEYHISVRNQTMPPKLSREKQFKNRTIPKFLEEYSYGKQNKNISFHLKPKINNKAVQNDSLQPYRFKVHKRNETYNRTGDPTHRLPGYPYRAKEKKILKTEWSLETEEPPVYPVLPVRRRAQHFRSPRYLPPYLRNPTHHPYQRPGEGPPLRYRPSYPPLRRRTPSYAPPLRQKPPNASRLRHRPLESPPRQRRPPDATPRQRRPGDAPPRQRRPGVEPPWRQVHNQRPPINKRPNDAPPRNEWWRPKSSVRPKVYRNTPLATTVRRNPPNRAASHPAKPGIGRGPPSKPVHMALNVKNKQKPTLDLSKDPIVRMVLTPDLLKHAEYLHRNGRTYMNSVCFANRAKYNCYDESSLAVQDYDPRDIAKVLEKFVSSALVYFCCTSEQ